MAWNVVIAGGGFGGAAAAHELERVMPKQAARLALVNETNFALYTPFLPEAAAGVVEPRPGGGCGELGAAARGDAAAGDAETDLPADRRDRRPRPRGEDGDGAGQIRRN